MKDKWLVVLCHSMDDFPIRLFSSYDDAAAFVKAHPIYTKGRDWWSGPAVMEAYGIAGVDASTPLGFKIWHFKDGVPTGWETAAWDATIEVTDAPMTAAEMQGN